jgi:hypothetical protein
MTRLTAQERLWRSVSEATVQSTLQEAANVLGALWFHDTDARRDAAGWPDVALTVPGSGTLYLLECKTETARLRPEQMLWGLALLGCDRVVYDVVRPSNLQEIIEKIARGR